MAKKKLTPSKKTAKKGPGRGWHGSSSDHAAAGKKGGFARAARWRAAHAADSDGSQSPRDGSVTNL